MGGGGTMFPVQGCSRLFFDPMFTVPGCSQLVLDPMFPVPWEYRNLTQCSLFPRTPIKASRKDDGRRNKKLKRVIFRFLRNFFPFFMRLGHFRQFSANFRPFFHGNKKLLSNFLDLKIAQTISGLKFLIISKKMILSANNTRFLFIRIMFFGEARQFLKFGKLSLGDSYKYDSYYIKENDFECTTSAKSARAHRVHFYARVRLITSVHEKIIFFDIIRNNYIKTSL